jgi:hypothetical protein
MKKYLICFFLIYLITYQWKLTSQIEVGAWREHLPYNNATAVVNTGDKIFCSSPYALFYYNPGDYSINKLSRSNGLSDVGVSAINYDQQNALLMVAYENANIDIIKGTTVLNISDIKTSQVQGDKRIYQIVFRDNLAYLACGFGIVVIDLVKNEVKETYYIGPNASAIDVLSIVFDENYIYAATGSGIYRALNDNPNLIDFSQWEKMSNLPDPNAKYTHLINYNSEIYTCLYNTLLNPNSSLYRQVSGNWEMVYAPGEIINNLRIFYNRLYVVDSKSISIFNSLQVMEQKITSYGFANSEPNDVYLSNAEDLYIADKLYGLVLKSPSSDYQSFIPNSPYTNHVGDIDAQNNQVVVAGGGHSSFGGNLGNYGEVYTFSSEAWVSNILWNDTNARDFSKVLINPYNPSQVFAGAWGAGVFVFENGQLSANYNLQNSTLQTIIPGNYIRIGGMALDPAQNLYITNVGVPAPISVRTYDGSWYSYNYPELSGGGDVAEIINTQGGNNWVQLYGAGLFAFNDNNTPSDLNDDQHKRFLINDESGQSINQVFSLAEDENGIIWVGTNEGVFTYFNPENVFIDDPYLASRVKVVDQNDPNVVQYLLSKEKILAIAIDGANRKWFGTENSGVFLLSENCEKEIFHFTKENSKLLSNKVFSIAIEPKTGEVFFGTDIGVVSFKSTATKGDDTYAEAYVYPNPVREDYDGLITITGLAANVNVKITDIAGQIVYETKAFGGQAIWNGKSFSGKRVKTGVYLVFCADENGKKKKVLKLLFIN